MNEFALQQPFEYSRSTLVAVIVAHVAAALLAAQLFEAKRYVEPVPLMVDLMPAPQQQTETPLKSVPVREPVREVRREPEPRLIEPRPAPIPEPIPVPEPPRLVRHQPEPVARPVPEPKLPVQKLPEPEMVLPTPVAPSIPAPPVPQPVVAEAPVAPVPPRPEPVAVAPQPQPVPVAVPAPVAQAPAAEAPEEISMTSQMLSAVYLRNPKPAYPRLSRRLGEQGTVMLRVFVTLAGDPTRVELKSSSGFPRLDRAAQDAVQRWKFTPAKRGDDAVDAWVLVPIRFSLKG